MITINRTKTGLKTKTTKLKNFVENFELDTSNDLKKLSLEEKLNNTSDVLNHIVELRTKVCELPEDVNIDNALEELENLEDTLSEIKVRLKSFLIQYDSVPKIDIVGNNIAKVK
ncbi:hypothetical protein JTE90_014875 [Oedothorax gibbosus]|uniref:Uncharacterized protein n=1 Tax=Oedothorax gibbosus TaxID=931172 RepID=A0AAV6TSE5_9ARAC|nr:hypothetical protein JTE90_014875 [Oedothorax gibbosus]